MKPVIRIPMVLVAACALGLAQQPPTRDQCLLALKPVFQSDDEQVFQLTIATRETTQYRIVSSGIWGSGDLAGDTTAAKGGRRRAEDSVWLVFSYVAPSGDGPAYLKTILKGARGTLTQTREVAKGPAWAARVADLMAEEPKAHSLDVPVVIADLDGQRVRVMVGPKSQQFSGAHDTSSSTAEPGPKFTVPRTWTRRGLVLGRPKDGTDFGVSGDPCVLWDEAIRGWRMVLFSSPPGHGQAVCLNRDDVGPGQWAFEGPLPVANPEAVGGFHKPFVVMDPDHPNHAAKIDGRYCLLVVSFKDGHKQVQRAWSEKLAGPWTFEPQAIIPRGEAGEFDEKHTDAVTGYYFSERKEFLYFYMGYPAKAQARKISPFGSAQAVATQKLGEKAATKCGVILEPCQQAGHWASGWVGGLQLLRGAEHRWVAVLNASPTAPDPGQREVWTEEPPPSLGGFAWCDEEWPVRGWHFAPEPIEWVKDIPQEALDAGEGYNLWRQFIHVLPDGRAALFYNSGYYGREQLYLKVSGKD